MVDAATLRSSLLRQSQHWLSAATRLGHFDELASGESWHQLERYLGLSIRDHLRSVVNLLKEHGAALVAAVSSAESQQQFIEARRLLLNYRRQYLRAEITVDFYSDAINSRTSTVLGARLRACDVLAYRSMSSILDQLGKQSPVALTYIDKGLGASILKAGLRLWDGGSLSVAAAIKLVRHNLDQPTSLIHEAGHQVAHILSWNEELAAAIDAEVGGPLWSGWASEIAADAIAFVHTGLGAVLALQDVLSDDPDRVFGIIPGDPHPTSYLRVLLGIEMCRLSWGRGEWDDVAETWETLYPLRYARADFRALIDTARAQTVAVARITIATPMKAFHGKRLIDLANPDRVSPSALSDLERRLGPALYTSSHWIWTEALRLLAITALRGKGIVPSGNSKANDWMLRLGGLPLAA